MSGSWDISLHRLEVEGTSNMGPTDTKSRKLSVRHTYAEHLSLLWKSYFDRVLLDLFSAGHRPGYRVLFVIQGKEM